MSTEYTAPAALEQMRDMIGEAGRLLSPFGTAKSRSDAIEMASRRRLSAGRVKRLIYGEVKSVPKHEFEWVHDWLNILRARLGKLEEQYSTARQALLEQAAGDPVVARLAPPDIGPDDHRPVAPSDSRHRLSLALLREHRRRAPWGR